MRISLRYSSSKPDLPLEIKSDDTVQVLHDRSRSSLETISASLSKDFYLIWGGSVLADDETSLSTVMLTDSSIVHVVAPSTSFLENQEEIMAWLPKIFNIDIHYPLKQEQHDFSTKDLFKRFCNWVDTEEAVYLWNPNKEKWRKVKEAVDELESTEPSFLGSRHVKFYGSYGCALLSKVVHADETVHLALIGLDGWELEIYSGTSGRVPSSRAPPEKKKRLNVGKIKLSKYHGFLDRTSYFIRKAEERRGVKRSAAANSQGHQKTPAFVGAAMEDALFEIDQEATLAEGVTPPQGGFTDVGLHTGGRPRDTVWSLVRAILQVMVTDSPFMQEVFLEFLVALVECFAASQLHLVSNPWGTLTDTMMQILRETVLDVADILKDESQMEQWGRFEARCVRLRHQLRRAHNARAKKRAAVFKLGPLKREDISIRNFNLSAPGKTRPPYQARSLDENRHLASKNLRGLPVPSLFQVSGTMHSNSVTMPSTRANDGDVKRMLDWIQNPELKLACKGTSAQMAEAAFLICRTVENFFYYKVVNELPQDDSTCHYFYFSSISIGEACRDIERLMDKYRKVACLLQENPTYCLLSVETRSRELLTVWAGFCLVHDMMCSAHPIIEDYNPALDPGDLEHLSLADKSAIDSLQRIVAYLRFRSSHRFCIFSLHKVDRTLNLAHAYGHKEFRNKWLAERTAMKQREEQRWKDITQRQERLTVLDSELRDHKNNLQRWENKLSDFSKPRYGWNATTAENDTGYKTAEEKVEHYQRRVCRVEGEIRNTETAPLPILQPLPESEQKALPILFFLLMPVEFQVLSRLSFCSQQQLLPIETTLSLPTIYFSYQGGSRH